MYISWNQICAFGACTWTPITQTFEFFNSDCHYKTVFGSYRIIDLSAITAEELASMLQRSYTYHQSAFKEIIFGISWFLQKNANLYPKMQFNHDCYRYIAGQLLDYCRKDPGSEKVTAAKFKEFAVVTLQGYRMFWLNYSFVNRLLIRLNSRLIYLPVFFRELITR